MLFDGDFTEAWGEGEERCCKLTFIGKHLDHASLRQGFDECLVTPENMEKRRKALRFKVGDRVEWEDISGWVKGTVVELLYNEESFGPGFVAPYRVQDEKGKLSFAEDDTDDYIRKDDTPPTKKTKKKQTKKSGM